TPIRVRQGHGALDIVGNGFASRVGNVVDGQDDDVVAHADASVVAAIPHERSVGGNDCHLELLISLWIYGVCAYQRLVLMFCTWAGSPALMGATTLPMSTPYLKTVSPTAMSLSATLCPIGMSCCALTCMSLSSSIIQAVISVPAVMPSTTATATVSLE